ncbi:MAG: sigma 54-interacting transcriptional regulator [Deltaproteobacteria bacterium]|nr:sigma 54-interacting transcriptional regulator [Deltaproteobacteria bacterium]
MRPRLDADTATHDLRTAPRAAPAGGAGLVLLWAPVALPEVIRLGDAPLLIGREPPPGGLTILHAAISRVHARIHHSGSTFVLTDLDSRNGTLVQGCRVRSIALEHGDEIRIGDAMFAFVDRDVDAFAGPASGPFPALVGGARTQRVAREIAALAQADLPLTILGETGTGKEVIAQAIHVASGRSGRVSAINCAAIPANLLESELFGYKRGAFSGADRDKIGLVTAANKGTLFLDEIGDLAPEAQAKLLRLLETREVLPVGALAPEKVDVRVVSATHRDLEALVAAGRFRGDLYARLAGHVVRLLPLRERKEDLRLLVPHLLARHGASHLAVSAAAMGAIIHYDWPYNVRELEAALRRAVALVSAEGTRTIDVRHLSDAVQRAMEGYGTEASTPSLPPPAAASASRDRAPDEATMRALLERHRGNVAAIARELRKDRVQVHRWMKRWGLRPDDFRG